MQKFLMTACAALALTACGGGGNDGGSTAPTPRITAVKVVGDSLADSGTFGYKFTVQGSALTGAGSTPIWPELVARHYGLALCPHYTAGAAGASSTADCTNYAVGGGVINAQMAAQPQLAITRQLQDAGDQGYAAGDLLLVDGGGNDASDLITAYLAAAQDGGAAFADLLGTVLDHDTLAPWRAQGAAGLPQAGAAYMGALATQWVQDIQHQALDRGAPRVAVLNLPPVTLTPKVRVVLQAIAHAQGDAAASQLEALFASWVQAFNTQLAAAIEQVPPNAAGDARIVLVDFAQWFSAQIAQPDQNGYTNTTTPACPATGVDANGLPSYTLSQCTASALSAMTPPPGASDGSHWWQHYAFADAFHPTPYAHQHIGQLVTDTLAQAGW